MPRERFASTRRRSLPRPFRPLASTSSKIYGVEGISFNIILCLECTLERERKSTMESSGSIFQSRWEIGLASRTRRFLRRRKDKMVLEFIGCLVRLNPFLVKFIRRSRLYQTGAILFAFTAHKVLIVLKCSYHGKRSTSLVFRSFRTPPSTDRFLPWI